MFNQVADVTGSGHALAGLESADLGRGAFEHRGGVFDGLAGSLAKPSELGTEATTWHDRTAAHIHILFWPQSLSFTRRAADRIV